MGVLDCLECIKRVIIAIALTYSCDFKSLAVHCQAVWQGVLLLRMATVKSSYFTKKSLSVEKFNHEHRKRFNQMAVFTLYKHHEVFYNINKQINFVSERQFCLKNVYYLNFYNDRKSFPNVSSKCCLTFDQLLSTKTINIKFNICSVKMNLLLVIHCCIR